MKNFRTRFWLWRAGEQIKIIAVTVSFAVSASVAIPFFASAALVPCGDQLYNADTNPPPQGKSVGDISNPCGFNDFLTLVTNITDFLVVTGASVAALAFGYAGFLMMTASGEMAKIEEAKTIFGKVLTGFIIMLSAWLIVHAIEVGLLDTSPGKFQSLLK